MMSAKKIIYNLDILKSAIGLMDEAECAHIRCSNCALFINDQCAQRTLDDHLHALDLAKDGDDS